MRSDCGTDIDAAERAAEHAFKARYPESTRPEWFSRAVFRRARRVDSHQIEVSYRVERVVPLEPGFFWEELPTGRMLMRVDEETGKKWVVLTLDTDSFVDVFKVVFDVETRSLRVAVDEDLRLMNPEQLVLDPE